MRSRRAQHHVLRDFGGARSNGTAQAKAKLEALRARIAELTDRLGGELEQRDALSSRLRDAELIVTAKRRRLDTLRAAEAAAQRRHSQLRGDEERERDALQAQRAALAAQVRAAYMTGRHDELKLLLYQSNPASLGRTLAWYGYLAQERSAKIDEIQSRALRLEQLAAELDRQSDQLKALEKDASEEVAGLRRARADRAAALTVLTAGVASGNRKLADLKRQETALESLVGDLARVIQDFPADPQSFERMRGKLPWPVPGHVMVAAPNAHSNGEMIEAARGAKVRAPYFGRVVYADWLQGLGLLLIIGHGGGYMTLYGHAEVLYKSVGDRVSPGDVIAALSDGGAAPHLYFEIREGRKPIDPKVWLTPNP